MGRKTLKQGKNPESGSTGEDEQWQCGRHVANSISIRSECRN